MVIFWRTVHYLGKKYRVSIPSILRKHYERDPKTNCKALFVYKPGKAPSPKTRYFIWHKTPPRLSLTSSTATTIQDKQAYINTDWAQGRSQHKRLETRAAANHKCQQCGTIIGPLTTHHPNRLSKTKQRSTKTYPVVKSGLEQQTKLLCPTCHLAHHHHNTRQ